MKTEKIKNIFFICNHAAFFLSHRYNLLEFCNKNKMLPKLIIGKSASKTLENEAIKTLKNKKINYKILNYHTSKTNIFNEIISIIRIIILIINYKPSVVHSISNKPIIYSVIISFFLKNKFILSFSGFGYLYISKKNSLKKIIFEKVLKFFLNKRCIFIVQNSRDFNYLQNVFKISSKKIYLIKGSGIDLYKYTNNCASYDNNIILFPARPLISKGIKEFCESARILKTKYKSWKFVIVGDLNYESPDLVDNSFRKKYEQNNIVEFWGHQKNMIDIYNIAKIVCLPSYREGFPKVLIEAAAMGLPTVTSDDPGCVEAIIPNKTGLVSPVKNIEILCRNIIKLMTQENIYKKFSKESIKYAHESFSIKNVTDSHAKIYYSLMNE